MQITVDDTTTLQGASDPRAAPGGADGPDPDLGYNNELELTITAHARRDLLPLPYAPGRWRVPLEKAPNPGGYTVHELVPANGKWAGRVAVDFHGMSDKSIGADWRACIVAQRRDGAESAASPL